MIENNNLSKKKLLPTLFKIPSPVVTGIPKIFFFSFLSGIKGEGKQIIRVLGMHLS